MKVSTYIPEPYKIIHNTSVDFSIRRIEKPVHIVQYDKQLPIIAVSLYLNGKKYALDLNMEAKVRWSKQDGTYIYKYVLGCNQERNIVYFEIDDQMSYFYGRCEPVIELFIVDNGVGKKANSSPIYIEIDRNPIQSTDFESISEYSDIEKVILEAKEVIKELETFADKIEYTHVGEDEPESGKQFFTWLELMIME